MEDPAIRKLRVQTWYRAVQLASGKTPAQLEREFSNKTFPGRMLPRSCIWEKYRRGEVVPRSGRQGDLLLRVEARYPTTAAWLTSPLWRVTDKAAMSMDEIKQVYELMPDHIRSIFVASKDEVTGLFWRRPTDPEDACEALATNRDLDSFVAALNVVKEGETTQNQYLHHLGLLVASKLLPHIRHPAFGAVGLEELAGYLRKRLQSPGYLRAAELPGDSLRAS